MMFKKLELKETLIRVNIRELNRVSTYIVQLSLQADIHS